MSDVFNIFMPGAKHWDEVKRAEKMLLVESQKGGEGPGRLDLDEGFLVMRDRTGQATETSTDVGNPNRLRPQAAPEDEHKTASDDITGASRDARTDEGPGPDAD